MASGSVVRARAARNPKPKTTANNTNKKWLKTTRVSRGDIVQFRSTNASLFGNVGVVMGYLDKHTLLVRTFGGADEDYPPTYLGVSDRKPNENYTDPAGKNVGHNNFYYTNWIMSVVHRASPKPPKKRKPVLFHEITHEELPAVLTGEQEIPEGHKVVILPTPSPAP